MARPKVKVHRKGLHKTMKARGVEARVMNVARQVEAIAKANAPVDTGEYRDSISARVDYHPTRSVVHVGASAPHALIVEARTGNLTRALGEAG